MFATGLTRQGTALKSNTRVLLAAAPRATKRTPSSAIVPAVHWTGPSKLGVTVSPARGRPFCRPLLKKPRRMTSPTTPSTCFHCRMPCTSPRRTLRAFCSWILSQIDECGLPHYCFALGGTCDDLGLFQKGPSVTEHWNWLLLTAWLAWWLWGVNWKQAWAVLAQGAWLPVLLLMIVGALVWSQISPSDCN